MARGDHFGLKEGERPVWGEVAPTSTWQISSKQDALLIRSREILSKLSNPAQAQDYVTRNPRLMGDVVEDISVDELMAAHAASGAVWPAANSLPPPPPASPSSPSSPAASPTATRRRRGRSRPPPRGSSAC